MLKCKYDEQKRRAISGPAFYDLEDVFKQARNARMSLKNMQIHLTDLGNLRNIFEDGHIEAQRNYQSAAEDDREYNRSSISLEQPSDTKLSFSSSELSFSMLAHRFIQKFPADSHVGEQTSP